MGKNKGKIRKNTFSDCPSWFNKKQRAKYENDRATALREANLYNRLAEERQKIMGEVIICEAEMHQII